MNWLWSLYTLIGLFIWHHGEGYLRAVGHLTSAPPSGADSHRNMAFAGFAALAAPFIGPQVWKNVAAPLLPTWLGGTRVYTPAGPPGPDALPAAPSAFAGFDLNQLLSMVGGDKLEAMAFGVLERSLRCPGLADHLKELVTRVLSWGAPSRYSISFGWAGGQDYSFGWPAAATPPSQPPAAPPEQVQVIAQPPAGSPPGPPANPPSTTA